MYLQQLGQNIENILCIRKLYFDLIQYRHNQTQETELCKISCLIAGVRKGTGSLSWSEEESWRRLPPLLGLVTGHMPASISVTIVLCHTWGCSLLTLAGYIAQEHGFLNSVKFCQRSS